MKYIKLTDGNKAAVNNQDFKKLNKYCWKSKVCKDTYYAFYHKGTSKIWMHRLILGVTDPKVDVDHKNTHGWDNRRKNLRIATHQQNMFNKRRASNNTSGYKGVGWDKTRKKWKVKIKLNGVYHHLGRFSSKKEAAKAYDQKAVKFFSKFARLNFPK